MARKRMIDPSIWTDEGMAELSPRQQLLYIGLISNADDDGRLKGSESALRLILPTLYAGVALADITADVNAVLTSMRQIVRYEVAGRAYIAFLNYRQWQKIDRPSPSILPAPPERSSNARRRVVEESSPDRGVLDPNRIEENRSKENGREENTGDAPPAAASVRAAPKPSTLNRQQQERFDRFYAAYPNKQHRPEAERAWRKLDPDDTLTATLLADLAERKQGRKWGDRIIEHPSTYLNNRVWEDDIEPVRIQPVRASPNGAGKVTNGFMASWERDNGKDQHEPHDVSAVIDAPFTVRTAHGR